MFDDPKKGTSGDTLFDGTVEGMTAEWVMERPTDLKDSDKLRTLANYGATYFYGCVAATEPDTATLKLARTSRCLRTPS